MKTKLITGFAFFLLALSISIKAQRFVSLDDAIPKKGSSMGKSNATLSSGGNNGELKSLVYDLYPTIFYSKGVVTNQYKKENPPRIAYTDAASLKNLVANQKNAANIVLVKLIVESPQALNIQITDQFLNALPKLKYFLVETKFPYDMAKLDGILNTNNESIVWVFNSSSNE